VPTFPADASGSAPYDWHSLLTPVFDFESPNEALEWSILAIVETINDLGVARGEVAKCSNATAAPPKDTYECLEIMTQALVDSTAVCKSVVWRYWLWNSMARALFTGGCPIPSFKSSVSRPLRLT
jgi:hypothetical protein